MSHGENYPTALLKYFSEIKKCYLVLFHNILQVFYETVMLLEKEDILSSDVFEIPSNFKTKVTQRIADEFTGFMAKILK